MTTNLDELAKQVWDAKLAQRDISLALRIARTSQDALDKSHQTENALGATLRYLLETAAPDSWIRQQKAERDAAAARFAETVQQERSELLTEASIVFAATTAPAGSAGLE